LLPRCRSHTTRNRLHCGRFEDSTGVRFLYDPAQAPTGIARDSASVKRAARPLDFREGAVCENGGISMIHCRHILD